MHELWLSYIGSILTPCQANVGQMLQRLSRGDLNGAILTVKASTCASMTSLSGIVLYECANVFYLITPKDTLKSTPSYTFHFPNPPHLIISLLASCAQTRKHLFHFLERIGFLHLWKSLADISTRENVKEIQAETDHSVACR